MKREKVFCDEHDGFKPVMSPAGRNGKRGSERYICPRCSGVRELLTGTLYKVLPGYGFIATDRMEEVFFRFSQLEGDLLPIPGQKVSFELGFSQKGPVAVRIKPLKNRL